MSPINQSKFLDLKRSRSAHCSPLKFLDEYKIGLHVDPVIYELRKEFDFRLGMKLTDLARVDLRCDTLNRDSTYLGFSKERLMLPSNVIGSLHTRSTLARIGLDFFGSSTYVSPGFGAETPTKIVFEITARVQVRNLPLHEHVAGLVLYQINGVDAVWRGKGNHASRFPFVDLAARHSPVSE